MTEIEYSDEAGQVAEAGRTANLIYILNLLSLLFGGGMAARRSCVNE